MSQYGSLQDAIAQAIVDLDAWLETMRQVGGYGGPVAHWWQNRFEYAGPGLDWRYEGILIGYTTLYQKTGRNEWHQRLAAAAEDLVLGQRPDGTYRASRFEINPDTLGTPHEPAATLGLLAALPVLSNEIRPLETARRSLRNVVEKLWDGRGFNDLPGIQGRVPNKLATLAHVLMNYEQVGDGGYLAHAKAALDDVLRFQVSGGPNDGAIHQYAPGRSKGDGRFFPFYNARCVLPLVVGSRVFGEERYIAAAHRILAFIDRTMHPDGSWPQIIYVGGSRASWPQWLAGTADILLAYLSLDAPLPDSAIRRLLDSQLPSGGFPTAAGFSAQITQARPEATDYRDVVPVVGWNDKVLRLLSALLAAHTPLPRKATCTTEVPVSIGPSRSMYRETSQRMEILVGGATAYAWDKKAPWAWAPNELVNVR